MKQRGRRTGVSPPVLRLPFSHNATPAAVPADSPLFSVENDVAL
jgi:hypothetical protein